MKKPLASLAALASFLSVATSYAVATRSFVIDDLAAFSAGELTGTAAYSDGTLRAASPLDRVAIDDATVVWSSLRTAEGAVLLGTGQGGRVLRVDAGASAATVLAETGELVVTSFATDGTTIFAGTMPNGRVLAIHPTTGATRQLARLENAAHVWALAWDPHRNAVLAATGPEGRVYAVSLSGVATLLHDDEALHVQSLVVDEAGTVFAGTSDRALVLRIPTRGRPSVVWDFPGNEIASLAYRNGELLVVANEFADAAPAAQSSPVVAATTPAAPQAARPARPRAGKGKVFLVSREGRVELIASQDDAHFTAAVFGPDGAAWIASAKDGRVLRVDDQRHQAVVADVDERQVLTLASVEPLVFATGDGAALYRPSPSATRAPTWTSKVLDADFHARFGTLSWRGEGTATFATRSGNTTPPDATWSDWSAPLSAPGPIASPPSRFLQIRATLGARDTVVRSVTAHYRVQNQRAFVRDITFGARRAPTKRPEPAAPAEPAATSPDEPPAPSTSVRIAWRVDNPDGDRLRYRVDFRGETQSTWRPLTSEHEVLTRAETTWETAAIADGYYRVRVRASDELSNAPGESIGHAKESGPVLVDNHAPVIENLRYQSGTLFARITDTTSAIARVELAIDGRDFRPLDPRDGLLDGLREEIETQVALTPGLHVLALRAVDLAGNAIIAEVETLVAATR